MVARALNTVEMAPGTSVPFVMAQARDHSTSNHVSVVVERVLNTDLDVATSVRVAMELERNLALCKHVQHVRHACTVDGRGSDRGFGQGIKCASCNGSGDCPKPIVDPFSYYY